MGRHTLNNCDYFPHKNSMRNHRKVKALRNKFGQVEGYAFWSMFVEYLTGLDGNEMEYNDLECEMFAAELGITGETIKEMIDFCIKIELLFNKNGFIHSISLDEELAPVYKKRNKAKESSAARRRRGDGKFMNKSEPLGQVTSNNAESLGIVSTDTTQQSAEIPQKRVEESRVEESRVEYIPSGFFKTILFDEFWDLYDKKVGNKAKCEKKWNKLPDEEKNKIILTLPIWKQQFSEKQFQPYPETYLNGSRWNDEVIIPDSTGNSKKNGYSKKPTPAELEIAARKQFGG